MAVSHSSRSRARFVCRLPDSEKRRQLPRSRLLGLFVATLVLGWRISRKRAAVMPSSSTEFPSELCRASSAIKIWQLEAQSRSRARTHGSPSGAISRCGCRRRGLERRGSVTGDFGFHTGCRVPGYRDAGDERFRLCSPSCETLRWLSLRRRTTNTPCRPSKPMRSTIFSNLCNRHACRKPLRRFERLLKSRTRNMSRCCDAPCLNCGRDRPTKLRPGAASGSFCSRRGSGNA
jgi:hypothetical protein